MLMVIFGAGASYDAVPALPAPQRHPDRMPLGDELFGDRRDFTTAMDQFPACKPIIPRLRLAQPGSGWVEQALEQFQAEAADHPPRHQQLAAIRFYLQVMLHRVQLAWEVSFAHGITSYRTLLDQIGRWRSRYQRVCLVTFNYDTMLENSLDVVGLRLGTLDDYVRHDVYSVIKVHGSIDWVHDVNTPLEATASRDPTRVATELIERAAELDISRAYRRVPVGTYGLLTTEMPDQPIFPAVAIPVSTKSFECPEAHLRVLQDLIPQVTRLLIIGWRGTESHFIDMLRALRAPHATVVSGSRDYAQQVVARLKGERLSGRYNAVDGGFTDFVTRGAADEFLGR